MHIIYNSNVANSPLTVSDPKRSGGLTTGEKSTKLCRNISMYGSCKNENKGCPYNHRKDQTTSPHPFSSFPKSSTESPFSGRSSSESAWSKSQASFYPDNVPSEQHGPAVLQYNPTAAALPHTHLPGRTFLHNFFMSDNLRAELIRRVHFLWRSGSKDFPEQVSHYHSIFPLDSDAPKGNVFGWSTSVYQCVNMHDGLPYVIRKLDDFRPSNEQALKYAENWKQIVHPNIITLRELFISKDIGDVNSLFFAYDYHPGSETLESKYVSGPNALNKNSYIAESVLWSFICQIVSALQIVHKHGLAVRCISSSKVLLTGKNKIRLNCVGIMDVVGFDVAGVARHQAEDILALGKLILDLACRTKPAVTSNIPKAIEFVGSHYSKDFRNFLHCTLGKVTTTVADIIPIIAPKLLQEVQTLHNHTDLLESELSKEFDNGRLLRLLSKLSFVTERPEFQMDPKWAETGDRYLIKLFRDYVFHQVYEDNTPAIDFSHVIECLNKLDVGTDEKIPLMSRDEQSILIVTYADLKNCLNQAFTELVSVSVQNQKPNSTKFNINH